MNQDVFLCIALFAGVGFFLTDTVHRLITIVMTMGVYDGKKARNTALLGLTVGLCTSFVGHRPDEIGYWLSVANGAVWMTLVGFMHSAIQAMQRPMAYARAKFAIDHANFEASDAYAAMLNDPAKLQRYLDRTYGKGLVNAREEMRRIGKESNLSTTTASPENAQKLLDHAMKSLEATCARIDRETKAK